MVEERVELQGHPCCKHEDYVESDNEPRHQDMLRNASSGKDDSVTFIIFPGSPVETDREFLRQLSLLDIQGVALKQAPLCLNSHHWSLN